VITEILLAGLLRPNFRLNSKSCITYLYVDVKEPAEPDGSRSVWLLGFLLSVKLKTVVVCFILYRWWAWQDSNLRPCAYQAHALTN
jgi:hypothetical protein